MAGFRPIQDISGNSYTGKVQTFAVAAGHASLLASGDFVRITGTARASDGMAYVDAATAAQTLTGVVIGVDYNMANLEQKGLPAGTAGTVKVATSTNMLLEGTSSGTVALVDVGANADIVATEATLSGGLVTSNMTINTAAPAAATAQIRIVGLKDGATAAGSTVFCRINESTDNVVGV
jgi:hypothetical protein